MKGPILITLNRIKSHSPCFEGWVEVVRANGGVKVDFDCPFPVSSILDSNGLDDTLWTLKCLPEYGKLWRKFSWWLATQAVDNSQDQRVKNCLEVVARYIESNATEKELSAARSAARSATYAAYAARSVAWSATYAAWSATYAAWSATYAARSDAYAAQENKLREILTAGEWIEGEQL